jgi:hypothetical protein
MDGDDAPSHDELVCPCLESQAVRQSTVLDRLSFMLGITGDEAEAQCLTVGGWCCSRIMPLHAVVAPKSHKNA